MNPDAARKTLGEPPITRQAVDALQEALELTRRRPDEPTMRELHGVHQELQDELRKARAEGWDTAHRAMCDQARIGSFPCQHGNPYTRSKT